MSDHPVHRDQPDFRFLFRTDRGSIDRTTWWRGTLPLAVIALASSVAWVFVKPYTQNGLDRPPLVALLAYLYLVTFGFGIILLLICEYNLSAKRFAARGLPRSLAGVFPLSLLLAGAFSWYLPRSKGALPEWSSWIAVLLVVGIVIWNVVELGFRRQNPDGTR